MGDNFKKFIWGVMLLCVADFSSGECVIKGAGQIPFSLIVYHLVSLWFFQNVVYVICNILWVSVSTGYPIFPGAPCIVCVINAGASRLKQCD